MVERKIRIISNCKCSLESTRKAAELTKTKLGFLINKYGEINDCISGKHIDNIINYGYEQADELLTSLNDVEKSINKLIEEESKFYVFLRELEEEKRKVVLKKTCIE